MIFGGCSCDVEKPEEPLEKLREKTKTKRRGRKQKGGSSKMFKVGSHTPPPSPRNTTSEDEVMDSPKSVREAVHRLSIAVENLKVDADEAEFISSPKRRLTSLSPSTIYTVSVNILRFTDMPFDKSSSMYIRIYSDKDQVYRTKTIVPSSFEFELKETSSIEIFLVSSKTDEIMYAASIEDVNKSKQVIKLRSMNLDPDDDDVDVNPKIWIALKHPCTLLITILSSTALRHENSKEESYASFAKLVCNDAEYKTKLVSDKLEWNETFALHFASHEERLSSNINISILDWDVEDRELGNATFLGNSKDGTHKLVMRNINDLGDDHVPQHVIIRAHFCDGLACI